MTVQSTVFVSGGTGYIASHIIDQLLKENYKVISTARTQEKADKVLANFKNENLSFELVSDIADLQAFDHVFAKHGKDIEYVLHTASPVTFNVKDYEKDIMIPAVNGTKSILESIKKYAADNVKRVVLTSSFAAQIHTAKAGDPSITVNEDSWNDSNWEDGYTDPMSAYFVSKKVAETTAWAFLKENRDAVKFQLSTIMPGFVFGPQATLEKGTTTLNLSADMVNQVVRFKKGDKLPDFMCAPFIDVRDVARSHILAFQKEELAGQRLQLQNTMFSTPLIIKSVTEQFPELKENFPEIDANAHDELVAHTCKIDSSKTKKLLGFPFIDFDTSIRDAAQQILDVSK
ncbi:hypothetical protein RNJ44_02070 [Nakaseomyces bracarensis]|uniref:NAD-dependent epimerase/dehydratase domain-containing protein n=1 Tax=Nakaseomyces bracarensis TaxID=273131 RepID=A0ABR4NME4_9SACH